MPSDHDGACRYGYNPGYCGICGPQIENERLLARIAELERLGEALHGGNGGASAMPEDYDAWRAAVPMKEKP